MTLEQIKAALAKKGYSYSDKKDFCNFIWVRESDVITNVFSDNLYLVVNGKVIRIPVTTKPGLKGSILEPTTVEGVTGTAIIMPGQYLNAWQFRDTDKEFSEYPYFRQIKPINYWRDGDKDNQIDRVQPQLGKIFGTHWHKMSKVNDRGSGQVNNWSKGCMGAAEPDFKTILPYVRTHVKLYGDLFTGILLEAVDFKTAA
jgi:hypothetical protein